MSRRSRTAGSKPMARRTPWMASERSPMSFSAWMTSDRSGRTGATPKNGTPTAQDIAACAVNDDLPMPDCPTHMTEPPRQTQRLPMSVLGSLAKSYDASSLKLKTWMPSTRSWASWCHTSKPAAPMPVAKRVCLDSPRATPASRLKREGFLFFAQGGQSAKYSCRIATRSRYSSAFFASTRTHAWSERPPELMTTVHGILESRMMGHWRSIGWSSHSRSACRKAVTSASDLPPSSTGLIRTKTPAPASLGHGSVPEPSSLSHSSRVRVSPAAAG